MWVLGSIVFLLPVVAIIMRQLSPLSAPLHRPAAGPTAPRLSTSEQEVV